MVFSCSNASIESIYFNKQKLSKGLSKKSVLSRKPILPSSLAQPVNPQTTSWRQKGETLKPSLYWGRHNCIGNLSTFPTVTPSQNIVGLPRWGQLCQPWHRDLSQATHSLYTELAHSTVHFNSLCRETNLRCNPKEIQTYACGIWRDHWLPKESIKMYFSLSHLQERHLFPLS